MRALVRLANCNHDERALPARIGIFAIRARINVAAEVQRPHRNALAQGFLNPLRGANGAHASALFLALDFALLTRETNRDQATRGAKTFAKLRRQNLVLDFLRR